MKPRLRAVDAPKKTKDEWTFIPCTDPRFVYVPAAQTNIMKKFRAMGWVPPSEQKENDK